MKKKEKFSEERLDKLRDSKSAVGAIYPILLDSKGLVIDGKHRKEVDPNWKTMTLENVTTEEQRLIVSAHCNLSRRNMTKKERVKLVNDLAEIYLKKGLKVSKRAKGSKGASNEIVKKLNEVLEGCIGEYKILEYLEDKYKQMHLYKKRDKTKFGLSERNVFVEKEGILDTNWGKLIVKFGRYIEKEFRDKEIMHKIKRELFEEARLRFIEDPSLLEKQIESVSLGIIRIECPFCEDTFYSKLGLSIHLSHKHKKTKEEKEKIVKDIEDKLLHLTNFKEPIDPPLKNLKKLSNDKEWVYGYCPNKKCKSFYNISMWHWGGFCNSCWRKVTKLIPPKGEIPPIPFSSR